MHYIKTHVFNLRYYFNFNGVVPISIVVGKCCTVPMVIAFPGEVGFKAFSL